MNGRLYEFAKKIGLTSGLTKDFIENKKDFIAREGYARYITEKVLQRINPDIEVTHMPQLATYDVEFTSGGTQVKLETKVRMCSSEHYENSKISPDKGGFLNRNDGWLLVFYWEDCRWYIWDLADYSPKYEEGSWTHQKDTSNGGRKFSVKEGAWIFDFKAAKFSGRLQRNKLNKPTIQ